MQRLRYFSLAVGISLVTAGFFAAVPANAQDPLPATGNTECLNETAGEIDCTDDTAPCFGQDAFYATQGVGCPHDEFRFDIDEAGTPGTTQLLQLDDTVTDNCTDLMWQRETADVTDDGVVDTFSSNDDEPNWQGALQYCETLDFGGFQDWRLPNIRELLSINKWGNETGNHEIRASSPPFNTFVGAGWSSTTATSFSGSAFVVEQGGFSKDSPKMSNGGVAVRCVRTVLVTDGGGGAVAREQGQGGVTVSGNGDVNADNGLDLSDAVYLLSHLFQGGPAPEPCPDLGPQPETDCENSEDDDLDGDTDCDDSDCAGIGTCPPVETNCDNEEDDDLDGDTDCDDFDCAGVGICPPVEAVCNDGIDDDLDGDTDCDDSDCGRNPICAQGDPSLLPDTGQTLCYDAEGAVISCRDPDFPGQDGFYSTGCPMNELRFVVNEGGTPADTSDDTVLDTCTGLTWQRDTPDFNGEEGLQHTTCRDDQGGVVPCGSAEDTGVRDPADAGDDVTWCDALFYCEDLTFAGESDWRLPNVMEAQSIADYSQAAPAMETKIFGVAKVGSVAAYWTSTSQGPETDPPKVERAWWFYTHLGEVSPNGTPGLKTAHNFVRAVRDAP